MRPELRADLLAGLRAIGERGEQIQLDRREDHFRRGEPVATCMMYVGSSAMAVIAAPLGWMLRQHDCYSATVV